MQDLDALIVSHGQPSSPESAGAALAEFAAKVQPNIPGIRLGAVTMAAPGRLEEALERLAPGGPVYPMFMSDGWFVKTALARRLGDAPVSVMTPLGLEPALPGLAINALRAAFGQQILLAAHGSANARPAPERAARDFAAALEAALPGLSVTVGFLEQAPFISDVAQGMDNAVCMPFFAMHGDHVRQDLPLDLDKAGFSGPVLPEISALTGVSAMVAQSIEAAFKTPGTTQE